MDWATYHGDGARTGAASVPVSTPPRSLWTAHVNGAIYAQPVAASGLVVVATERDVVVALDAATGAVRWSTPLGSPVAGSSLPCGDIDPSGITGTPVVAGGVVYVAAFVAPAHHVLFAIDLLTGAIREQSPVDLPGLSPTVEQQRGALTVANGRVYVPFGGLYGDCGQYKGGVVGATLADLS
ncbi:MAG TPA: PQQ-binding-like beta-propeller repeat protein, partial [Acidimicrobiales bacterium]|nr:PQQ-binding-like beta-propeller repeat protein [Acidimicrobiales bacterium]